MAAVRPVANRERPVVGATGFANRGSGNLLESPRSVSTIHLIAIGDVEAIPAAELRAGMRVMWNYGYTSDVVAIAPKGRDSLSVTLRSNRTGDETQGTFRKGTFVAAFWPKQKATK